MRGKSVAWLGCRRGKHRDGAKGRGKNEPEQKEVMAALQEEVVGEECGRRCTKRRAPELSQGL